MISDASTTATRMVMVPNIENASQDSSLPIRNRGAESLSLCQLMNVITIAPSAIATVSQA